MLPSLLASIICNTCCFLYPAYASYKALAVFPAATAEADAKVERWLMYWAVVGSWSAVEGVVGWTFNWLPFYSLLKTLFFLALSVPQSEASTYIYRARLAPLFHEHERDIDAFLASLRSRASETVVASVGWLWSKVREQMNVVLPAAQAYARDNDPSQLHHPANSLQPPTLQDPASGAVQQLYTHLSRYAGQYMPVALSALQVAAASAASRAGGSGSGGSRMTGSVGVRAEQVPEQMNMPVPIPTPAPHSAPSDPSLRSRAYLFATGSLPQGGASNAAHPSSLGVASASRLSPAQPRSASSPTAAGPGRLTARSSDESVHSHSSRGSASGGGGHANHAGWQPEISYENIRREEVVDVPIVPQRPSTGERRRSGWFGWGGSDDDKAKAE